jgi:hypothetical protein
MKKTDNVNKDRVFRKGSPQNYWEIASNTVGDVILSHNSDEKDKCEAVVITPNMARHLAQVLKEAAGTAEVLARQWSLEEKE